MTNHTSDHGALFSELRKVRASFIYDEELGVHVPACSGYKWADGRAVRCSNGPLTGQEIDSGVCSEGPHLTFGGGTV